jgi:Na+/melibiose symporter-like transporter
MNIFADLKDFTREQWAAFIASLLGWTLDAFDFFLVVFVLRSIATDFHTQVVNVAYALTLTLMFRPLGALIFGWLADKFGRRPILMVDILLFSLFEIGSAFAPTLTTFLILRALFGIDGRRMGHWLLARHGDHPCKKPGPCFRDFAAGLSVGLPPRHARLWTFV